MPIPLRDYEVIDAHIHAFPPRVFEAVWRWFDTHGWPIAYPLPALEGARFLLARGVSHVVALHYSHVPGMARGLNAFAAALAREEPRVIACATVLPGEPGARAILDEALGPLGCRGVKIHCHVQCVAADDPRLDDVYAAAAAHDVPVVIHAGDAPASPHYKCDVAALCPPDAIDRALARHPKTKVIVPHLGAARMEEIAALLARHERLWLDTTMALGGDEAILASKSFSARDAESVRDRWLPRAAKIIAAHWPRLLYGTDFPNIPYRWDRELALIAELGLSTHALAALLAGNARQVFRITPPPQ